MVSMKDEDYFHNLPHNELEELCSKHGLPTHNKTKPQLANMLLSWYHQRKSDKFKDKKDGCIRVESQLHPNWETNKGKVAVRVSDVERSRSSSYSKEIPVPTMDMVLSSPFNSHTAEINTCSTLEAQQVSGGSLLGSKNDDIGPKLKDKGNGGSVKKGDYNQKRVDLAKVDRAGNVQQSQCSKKNLCDVPTYSRSPSHRVDKKLLPSFEFYVRSEEGINLCVDLDSSPLDWIKMLNDGVCIHPDTHNSKPWVLHREVKSLGGFDEDEEKVSSPDNKVSILDPDTIDSSMGSTVREMNSVKDVQLSTADRSPRSSVREMNNVKDVQLSTADRPPRSSVREMNNVKDVQLSTADRSPRSSVREMNNVKDVQPSTADRPPRSSVREMNNVKDVQLSTADQSPRLSAATKSNSPLEISVPQQEKNKLNSSIKGPNFDIRTPMNMCIKSSPRSTKKSIQVSDVRSAEHDIVLFVGLDDQTQSEKSKMCFMGTSVHNVSLPFAGEVLQTSEPYSGQLHSSSTNCNSVEMQLSEVAHICEDMSNSPCQNGRAPDSDNLMHNLQNEIDRSAERELDLNKSLDALSIFPEERQRSDLTNETETSECYRFEVKAKKHKRTNSSDSEGIQNKRQKRQVEDSSYPTIKNLRILRDKTRRQRLPRRSMRLVPK